MHAEFDIYAICHKISPTPKKNPGFDWNNLKEKRGKKSVLPGGESNPGLPRDRRGYSPLYYRGLTQILQIEV